MVGLRRIGAVVLLLVACTGDDTDGATDEFCEAYGAFAAAGPGERVDHLRQAVELAPSGTGPYLDLLLTFEERTGELLAAGFVGDLSGDPGMVQLVATMRRPAAVESRERLQEVLAADCGHTDPVEQPTIAPSTSTAPLDG